MLRFCHLENNPNSGNLVTKQAKLSWAIDYSKFSFFSDKKKGKKGKVSSDITKFTCIVLVGNILDLYTWSITRVIASGRLYL